MSKNPNIIFLNTDQQTWDAISAYGNSYLKTPNIDRIVSNGKSFMRSYCTDPVCAPARASWATGMYSSETGVPFNGGNLYEDIPDIGQILNKNGYNAFHSGKWHVPGRDVRDSFKCLYFGKSKIGAGGAEFYDPATTRSVLDFLSKYKEDKPFYLQVGLVNPHDVCEYEHNHESKKIPGPLEQGFLKESDLPPLPENFIYDKKETVVQKVMRRGKNPIIHKAIMNAADNWTEEQWRFLCWHLYRFTEKVDIEIGMILNALEASPFKENSLIIFSIDHGESAGRHKMIQKFTLYQESIKVPFVVASLSDKFNLEKNSRDEKHLISAVDFLPTVLDYAGIDVPDYCHGRSIRPLIENKETDWRDFVYLESNCWGRALVTDRYKYVTEYIPQDGEITIPGPDAKRLGLEQLFDLKTDPNETKNLVDDKSYIDLLADFREKLLKQEKELNRRALIGESGKNVMLQWGQRIIDYWQSHPKLKDA